MNEEVCTLRLVHHPDQVAQQGRPGHGCVSAESNRSAAGVSVSWRLGCRLQLHM